GGQDVYRDPNDRRDASLVAAAVADHRRRILVRVPYWDGRRRLGRASGRLAAWDGVGALAHARRPPEAPEVARRPDPRLALVRHKHQSHSGRPARCMVALGASQATASRDAPAHRSDRELHPEPRAQGPLRSSAPRSLPSTRLVRLVLLPQRSRHCQHRRPLHRCRNSPPGAWVDVDVLGADPDFAVESLLTDLSGRALADRCDRGCARRYSVARDDQSGVQGAQSIAKEAPLPAWRRRYLHSPPRPPSALRRESSPKAPPPLPQRLRPRPRASPRTAARA